jgi:hypothetical protein
MDDCRGEKKPERTYVMKDGDSLVHYLASVPVTDHSDSHATLDSGSDSTPEETDTQTQPPSDPEDDHVIDARVSYIGSVDSPQAPPKSKPES